jgi:hypothetical protein
MLDAPHTAPLPLRCPLLRHPDRSEPAFSSVPLFDAPGRVAEGTRHDFNFAQRDRSTAALGCSSPLPSF